MKNNYSYSKNIKSTFKLAENKIKEVLQNVEFSVLTEISIKDAFKVKLNLEYKNYKILGACNPSLAYDAVNFEDMVCILMPCNIVLIDNEDGTIKVVFPNVQSILDITNNQNLIKLTKRVDSLLKSAFNQIS